MTGQLLRAIDNRDAAALARMAGQAPNVQSIVNPEAERLVDALFRQLKQVFPAASQTNLRNESDESAAKKQWIAAFAENGVRSREQVSAGMQHARASESPFWPSPGQFVAWCKQGALKAAGLPDANELYVIVMTYVRRRSGYVSAEAYPWPSTAAYWMVTNIADRMRHEALTEAEVRKACGAELKLMAKRIESGEILPEPKARLPEMNMKRAMSKSEGLSKIAELRAKFGLKSKDS